MTEQQAPANAGAAQGSTQGAAQGSVQGSGQGFTQGFTQPDLKVYGRLAWRWLWLVVLCALIGGAAAYLVSLNLAPTYQAASKVMINEARTPSAANYNDILASERVARTYADLMKRPSVMNEAFVRLGLDPGLAADEITDVTVSPVRDTQLVALTIEGRNPQLLAAVANTLPAVFVDELRQIQVSRFAESKASLTQQLDDLSRQVETTKLQLGELEQQRTAQEELEYTQLSSALTQYQTSYANLLQSYENLRLTEAQSTDTIVLIEPAAIPEAPVRPRVLVNTLLAAVVGALGALGLVFLVEYLDDRVRTPEDLQRLANLPVLGAIGLTPADGAGKSKTGQRRKGAKRPPERDPLLDDAAFGLAEGPPADVDAEDLAKLISITDPRHPIVEAYRRLRTNLQYYSLDAGLTSIMLASAEAGEGKSVTSANLAVVMAQSGARVILIDADLRKPRQHHIFRLLRLPGLAEALRGGFSSDLLQPVAGVPNLRVLTAGEGVPNPAEVLGSQRMRQLVEKLRGEADMLIFDTPPLLAVTDAQVVGHLVDGALLVINSQKTSAGAVHRAIQSMVQVNVPVMGAVLNRLSMSGRSYYYYYYYYSHSYYQDGAKSPKAPADKTGTKGGVKRPSAQTIEPLPAND
ncbi:MAG: polysaccharide biosynthesis tyrosine autokinase [Caldilineaceae bacterium]